VNLQLEGILIVFKNTDPVSATVLMIPSDVFVLYLNKSKTQFAQFDTGEHNSNAMP